MAIPTDWEVFKKMLIGESTTSIMPDFPADMWRQRDSWVENHLNSSLTANTPNWKDQRYEWREFPVPHIDELMGIPITAERAAEILELIGDNDPVSDLEERVRKRCLAMLPKTEDEPEQPLPPNWGMF